MEEEEEDEEGKEKEKDLVHGDAELVGGDLGHLGVKALTHFSAAVGERDGAVRVDVDESAGLVELVDFEADVVFGGDDGKTWRRRRTKGREGRRRIGEKKE